MFCYSVGFTGPYQETKSEIIDSGQKTATGAEAGTVADIVRDKK